MPVDRMLSSSSFMSNEITCWSKQISISVTVTGTFHLCSRSLSRAHVPFEGLIEGEKAQEKMFKKTADMYLKNPSLENTSKNQVDILVNTVSHHTSFVLNLTFGSCLHTVFI